MYIKVEYSFSLYKWFGFRFGIKNIKNKNPLNQGLRGFKGGPTCTQTNPLNISISISYKDVFYPQGNKNVTFWVIFYLLG